MTDNDEASSSDKSKIRIKLGKLEIKFEGSESFLENHIQNLVELLASVTPIESESEIEEEESELLEEKESSKTKKIDMSTSTIANKLGAASGRDLVLAACAHLHLVKGHEKYERKNILAEMKTATSYYKKTYTNNLTAMLQRLVKSGELNEIGENVYALEAKKAKGLESSLSGK